MYYKTVNTQELEAQLADLIEIRKEFEAEATRIYWEAADRGDDIFPLYLDLDSQLAELDAAISRIDRELYASQYADWLMEVRKYYGEMTGKYADYSEFADWLPELFQENRNPERAAYILRTNEWDMEAKREMEQIEAWGF